MSADSSQLAALAAELGAAAVKADRTSSEALAKVGARLRDDVRAAAPVLTGETKSSVKLKVDGSSATVTAGGAAFWLEFGTSDTRPQPFVWPQIPAADTRLAEALGDISPFNR